MKNKMYIGVGVLCALILVSAPGAAVAQAPARYDEVVPGSAIIVVSIPEVDELKQFIASPEFAALLDLTGMRAEVEQGFAEFEQQFNTHTGLNLKKIYEGLAGDLTFAISRLDIDAGEEGVDVLVLCGMSGGDAEVWSLLRAVSAVAAENEVVSELIQVAGQDVFKFPGDMYLTASRGHLVLANRFTALESLLGAGPRLRDAAQFVRHHELAKLNRGMVAYCDFTPFKGLIQQAMAETPTPSDDSYGEAQSMQAVLRAFDLDKLESFSLQMPLTDNAPLTMFIKAREYGGILSRIFSGKPVSTDAIAAAPANYDNWMAMTINRPIDIYHSMIELAQQFDADLKQEDIDTGLAAVKEAIGIDLLADVLAPMGDTLSFGITLDSTQPVSMLENPLAIFQMMEMEFCLSLADETALRATADKIIAMAGQWVNVTSHGNATIYSPNVPGLPLDPCVAIHRGQLRIATFGPERMKQTIDMLEAGQVISSHPDFGKTMTMVPNDAWAVGFASVDYVHKWADISLAQFPVEGEPEEMALYDRFRSARDTFLAGAQSMSSYMRIIPDGLYLETRYSLKTFLYFMSMEVVKYSTGIASWDMEDEDYEDEELEDEEIEDGELELEEEGGR